MLHKHIFVNVFISLIATIEYTNCSDKTQDSDTWNVTMLHTPYALEILKQTDFRKLSLYLWHSYDNLLFINSINWYSNKHIQHFINCLYMFIHKIFKNLNTFLFEFLNKMLIIIVGIHNSKQGRLWSDCSLRSSLIWVWAVCLSLLADWCSTF